MLKAIIAENDHDSGKLITSVLRRKCPDVNVIDVLPTVREARASIIRHNPDILILDIRLDDGSAFDLLNDIEGNHKIIFITAFETYALRAIKLDCVGYLVKPFAHADLVDAVHRARRSLGHTVQTGNVFNTIHDKYLVRMPVDKGMIQIETDLILRCNVEKEGATLYLKSGKEYLVKNSISELHRSLQNYGFCLANEEELINVNEVREFVRETTVVMTDGVEITLSQNRKEDLLTNFIKL